MAGMMLLAVVAVGGTGSVLAVRGAKVRIEQQVAGVVRSLAQSNFPLTDAVLEQMSALSGAAFVLVDDAGRVISSSSADGPSLIVNFRSATKHGDPQTMSSFRLDDRRHGYFHTALGLASRGPDRGHHQLHILYPEQDYKRAWQRAVLPSLVFVIVALPVVMALAAVSAARISRRVSRLQTQVNRIAEGKFQELALPEGDDEIRALGQAVNRMAAMLSRYETEVRRTERMRTLAHLGGGIAHQLRNSATGCGIALDLHAQTCPAGDDCESLDVAKRQLRLMEEYLQRFLQLGKPNSTPASERVDLISLIEDLLPLVEPSARHAGVELRWFPDTRAATIPGNCERLRQLVINLLLNAIEAAGEERLQTNLPAEVIVRIAEDPNDCFVLSVSDTGPGPAAAVQAQLFEPFVTEKPDGVGLGLCVVREVALEHGGTVTWSRAQDRTCFSVLLPRSTKSQGDDVLGEETVLANNSRLSAVN
jgi:signal transduction histidine kinase